LKKLAALFLTLTACSTLPPLQTPSFKPNGTKTAKPAPTAEARRPSFIWPLKDGRVSQGFKPKRKHRRGHAGVDIAAPRGSDVYASHPGLVIFAGRRFHGYGRLIIIETESGEWATFYGHLSKIRTKAGRRVEQGDLIGNVGRTGRATGYHLHFEVRHNKRPIDPLTVLP
jgi:murein DD-endopeptidase MepM/ murein hydrolase activator NlpD